MDYIHFNPVKHGLVTEVAAWPFSSFHKSVALGFFPLRGQARTMRRMIGASGVESSGGSELMVGPVVGGMQKGIPPYACYA